MSYRQFERLPATEYARRYSSTHDRLRAEIGNAFANDDHKPIIQYRNNGWMLVSVFAAGGLFWAILLWATMHH